MLCGSLVVQGFSSPEVHMVEHWGREDGAVKMHWEEPGRIEDHYGRVNSVIPAMWSLLSLSAYQTVLKCFAARESGAGGGTAEIKLAQIGYKKPYRVGTAHFQNEALLSNSFLLNTSLGKKIPFFRMCMCKSAIAKSSNSCLRTALVWPWNLTVSVAASHLNNVVTICWFSNFKRSRRQQLNVKSHHMAGMTNSRDWWRSSILPDSSHHVFMAHAHFPQGRAWHREASYVDHPFRTHEVGHVVIWVMQINKKWGSCTKSRGSQMHRLWTRIALPLKLRHQGLLKPLQKGKQ